MVNLQLRLGPEINLRYAGLGELDKGGKFLKKLWCCVGGSITR